MKTRLLAIIVIVISSIGITIGVLSQIDLYDYNKYYTVFGSNSPLAEIGTGKPVLTMDNCQRYAYWLTEHQKEKITLREDFSTRYPPWGNQIFPLVEYCTKTGQFDKTEINGMLKWEFNPVRQGMHGLPSEPIVTGKMAKEICSIVGGDCPPNYPANVQDDGSVMVGITTWDAYTNTGKSFVFIIKNNTLSYDVKENEN